MDKSIWRKIDRFAKKLKAINYLGGKCDKCGEMNFFKLSFHHTENKKYEYSDIREHRWSKIENELKKCQLLCHNCHEELHHLERINLRNNKKIYLEYKNIKGCEKCNYSKCEASLDFHHLDFRIKDFVISKNSTIYNNILELKEKIENELDKCIAICKNCHSLEHSDIEFFEKYKDIIIEKSKNLKEISSKIDRNEVKKMYNNGMKQIEITKYFKVTKGTISNIIKELKTNGQLSE